MVKTDKYEKNKSQNNCYLECEADENCTAFEYERKSKQCMIMYGDITHSDTVGSQPVILFEEKDVEADEFHCFVKYNTDQRPE